MLVEHLTRGLPRSWHVTIEWLLTIVGAIAIVLAVKQWIVNPYRIPSSSMEPTLHCAEPAAGCTARFSDRVLACRVCLDFRAPSRGEIVVFRTPPLAAARCGMGGVYVKRVIGMPGETVEERTGRVYVDGRPLAEPYVRPGRRDVRSVEPVRVPRNSYFMMGDNRADSCDSRSWGPVPRRNLIGTVVATYWPPLRVSWR